MDEITIFESAEVITAQDMSTITAASLEKMLKDDPHLTSVHSKRQYKSSLLDFDKWRAGRTITKTLVESYAAHLQSLDLAPNTINQKLAAIRWYARRLSDYAQDYLGDEVQAKDAARVALVEDVKGERPERGRHIDQGEISALLDACTTDRKNPTAGTRDAALIALAYQTGARREEIAGIELSDLTPNNEGIDVVIRHGKGNKARTVFIYNGTLSFLNDWLDLRGSEPGRLFCPVNKSGKIDPGGTMTGEALRQILEKRSAQAGLSEPITWHDFRRTFAGNLWDSGTDGVTIQKLMGHASQNQTAKYDRRPEHARRAAVKKLFVPYKPKK
jgi:integrase